LKTINSQVRQNTLSRRKKAGFRRRKLLTALIAISLAFTVSAVIKSDRPPFVQSVIIETLAPLHKALSRATDSLSGLWFEYVTLVGLKRENLQLSTQVEELKSEINRLSETEMRLIRLQKLIGFKTEKQLETVPVNVIGRESDNWSRMILLDRGFGDGLRKGGPLITSGGLVGRITQVANKKSKAMLITDWRSSVDALIQRTRVRGVVVGKSTELSEMKYIPLNADVRIGDRVVSSGFGGVFPKGLSVGIVVEVTDQKNGLFQKAMIIPAVDVVEFEEALVIVGYGK
jgi:rod shape-determining protein MreC